MKNVYVVFNPVAGPDDAGDVEKRIAKHFAAHEWRYEMYTTTGEEKLPEVVRRALEEDAFDLCVAAGGDGTVAGVASGLVHSGVPLGIIPAGTGNALARELEIPLQAPQALALLTGEHTLRSFDALQVEDSFYFLNLSAGVGAQVMLDTEREAKRKLGTLAYIWAGIKRLLGFQPYRFAVQINGRTEHFNASDVVVANSAIIGLSALRISPDVHYDDSRFNVCVVRARTLWDYIRILWDMLLGRQKRSLHLHFLEAERHVEITADPSVPIQADGEFIGRGSVAVSLVPQAVRIIAPA
jgi:diacylglycerol kinase (ATP)